MRAVAKDPLTGKQRDLPLPNDPDVIDLIEEVVKRYGKLSPARIVDLSHAKGSPWDVIVDRFQHHKVSVETNPRAGEPPSDDTPFA